MKKKVALVGAGGKMGMRLTRNLVHESAYDMRYLEHNTAGAEKLTSTWQVEISEEDDVLPDADIVILAVPDYAIQQVSKQLVPKIKSGALLVTLDPAAALAGQIHQRDDIALYITHPAHPSVFNWEPSEAAQRDYFGGVAARQSVVSALLQGSDEDYALGDALTRRMPTDSLSKSITL
jgi:hypothetical protein